MPGENWHHGPLGRAAARRRSPGPCQCNWILAIPRPVFLRLYLRCMANPPRRYPSDPDWCRRSECPVSILVRPAPELRRFFGDPNPQNLSLSRAEQYARLEPESSWSSCEPNRCSDIFHSAFLSFHLPLRLVRSRPESYLLVAASPRQHAARIPHPLAGAAIHRVLGLHPGPRRQRRSAQQPRHPRVRLLHSPGSRAGADLDRDSRFCESFFVVHPASLPSFSSPSSRPTTR